MIPAETLVCPDCGATAHLISFLPEEDELEPGDVVTYRCSGCGQRLDLVMEEEG